MGQDCNFTRSGFKDARTVPRDGVAIPSDAIGTYKRRFQNVLTPLRWRFLILYQAYGNLYATTGRKAHFLEDKKILSVGVFDEVIWEALGGNIRNLDSIWKETGQDCNFIRCGFKDARTVPEDGVAIPSDAVKT
ncbi:hypothetical protein Tco_0601110 [Tanacetum coccineum]